MVLDSPNLFLFNSYVIRFSSKGFPTVVRSFLAGDADVGVGVGAGVGVGVGVESDVVVEDFSDHDFGLMH